MATPLRSPSVVLLWAALSAACAGEGLQAPDVISRQAFVDTYVELRMSAIIDDDGVLDDAERAEILARHRVSEAQLLEFARVHGARPALMRDVWNEIEGRLDAERPGAEGSAG